jgi:hypothetical protein
VKKLLNIGLLRKQPGGKNVRAVMNYVLVEGAIETALRTIKSVETRAFYRFRNEAKKVD